MVEVRGVGLHSGDKTIVRFHPAEGALRFRVGKLEFRPLAHSVTDTTRCTVLGFEGGSLATVEHLLAALFIRGIWEGLLIEVKGVEIPILDGSAKEWLEALSPFPSAGPKPIQLGEPLEVTQDRSSAKAVPAETFSLLTTIAFPHPKIGYQQIACPPIGLADLASARTFGFLHEVEALRAQGLIRGASLENALVFSQHDFANTPRFLDEPVRHKALDALGDLYLVGQPVLGRFAVHRGSHRLHVALAQQIQIRLEPNL
jgi:UDP-3-O-[3-hydroxymyristoyl] N-acetylglucosamine deacetylase